jgi:hypothetical protein
MTESVPVSSERMTSKLALPERMKYVVRHSITNCRFGALPSVAVKTPPPDSSVRRSSWYGMSARSRPLIGNGAQPADQPPLSVLNCMLPFELTYALVKGVA